LGASKSGVCVLRGASGRSWVSGACEEVEGK